MLAGPSTSSGSSQQLHQQQLTGPSSFSLSELRLELRQIEVGPSHFAFLLADGRICRLPFSVISDRLDLSRNGQGSNGKATEYLLKFFLTRHILFISVCLIPGSGSASSSSAVSGSGGGGGGGSGPPGLGSASKSGYKTPQASGASLSSVRAPARTRGRIIRTTAIRGRGSTGGSASVAGGTSGGVIMSSSRPAPYVPEDLVAQAQSVLQVTLCQINV